VAAESQSKAREQERQQLRPYRRLVTALFTIGVMGLCGFMGRGIIHHLDRMPSADQFTQPSAIGHRALQACAEDLSRLERQTRGSLSNLFKHNRRTPHESVWQKLEHDRLRIIARCKLNHEWNPPLPAVSSLKTAADNIQSQIRSFHLLYSKYQRESAEYSTQSKHSIREATELLKIKR